MSRKFWTVVIAVAIGIAVVYVWAALAQLGAVR